MTEVAVFYFPGFHPDPRVDGWHGKGWTEWDLLRAAGPRFPGHRQPIVPAWGYYDESTPANAEREIDLAADHGITTFLFDWYWYRGPFLEGALRRGFLHARNRERLKFALMWANHDWVNLQPAPSVLPYQLFERGPVDRETWDTITTYVLDTFMGEPNYLSVDGSPFFTIYEPAAFIAGLGGVERAREAVEAFAARARERGHAGIHLNAVVATQSILPTEGKVENPELVLQEVGFSSATSYVWVHYIDLTSVPFPELRYADAARAAYDAWDECRARLDIPYIPNVTVGWDSSPRTTPTDRFERRSYPWMSVFVENTPAAVEEAVARADAFAQGLELPMITVNAWNEWTEGSYLLPDEADGTARIEGLRRGLQRRRP